MVNPLSRVAMENFLRDKKPIISKGVEKDINIDSVEEEIIKGLIRGKVDVMETTTRKTVITLDEAADKVKNNR